MVTNMVAMEAKSVTKLLTGGGYWLPDGTGIYSSHTYQ